jgi:EmrB/QacA subfamily drug resistance transporter
MSTVTAVPPPEKSKREIYIVFTGLMLVMLMAALDQTIVATALPTIVGDLGGLSHISWVVTAYLLAQTAVTPVYGKLGDLFGRKIVLQVGMVLFLVGSALCGLAQNLPELVAFRALQGLGGGGLMISTTAAIGDVVPPRDRGRYQGMFGAVFGVASVIGPLLGGFLTTSLSWRWIFYVNLPVGVLAFVVLAATLPSRKETGHVRIDYIGASLLAAALSAIVLTCTLGGTDDPWTSTLILSLIGASIVLVLVFVMAERRATEPVLPLRLFANRTFAVTSAVGLVVGFALFGSITYLPLFLQTVMGASPTGSGLQILPLMLGLLITSIGSGQIISATGRYRPFPIAGTFVMIIGLYLLSRLGVTTSRVTASAFMFVLGLGLGMVMQVLVLAVQNAVGYEDLGVATSGATLFRSIGGAVGTAILGSIFASRLKVNLAAKLAAAPGSARVLKSVNPSNPESLKKLPPAVHQIYLHAYADSLNRVFLIAAFVAAAAFALSWLLPAAKLRESVSAASGVGETFAMPKAPDSQAEMARALSLLVGREGRKRIVEKIAERAGVDLAPAACWLLVRLHHDASIDVAAMCHAYDVPVSRADQAMEDLHAAVLIHGDDVSGGVSVTELGHETAERLIAERRATFARLLDGWEPERHAELASMLTNLAAEAGLQPSADLVAR